MHIIKVISNLAVKSIKINGRLVILRLIFTSLYINLTQLKEN